MPVFALLAAVDFIVEFIFGLTETDTGRVNMIVLGLALLALSFVWGVVLPVKRVP